EARAVEVAAAAVEIGAAHGLIECVHDDPHVDRALGAAAAPGRVIHLLHPDRTPADLPFDRYDVPRELAQQIAARHPRRQRHALLRGRILDAAIDLEAMTVQVGQADAILEQIRSPVPGFRRASWRECPSLAKAAPRSYRDSRRCPSGLKGNGKRTRL